MGDLFNSFDIEAMRGKDITIGEHFPEVFVSDTDEIFCYLGICLYDDNHEERIQIMQPHYMKGIHSTDDSLSNEIVGFYRIMDGCIVLDDYVDGGFYNRHLFKRLNNVGIRLPHPDCYYAVFVNRIEDEKITQSVFGLTYNECESLLEAYAKLMGTHSDFYTYPKLTRSIRNDNFCDLTELWIPKQYPYVTFKDGNSDFSHVSLWGVYRHMQMLTGCKINSAFSQALIKCGATEDLLNRLFEIGESIYHQTKITVNFEK